jgi:hypothetical protein
MNKYLPHTEPLGYDFKPLIMEMSGRLHPKFKNLLADIAKHKERYSNIPHKDLLKYMIKTLVIIHKKLIADTIINKSNIANGDGDLYGQDVTETNFGNSDINLHIS